MGETRNMKWVVPGILFVTCMWIASLVAGAAVGWLRAAGVVFGFGGAVAALTAIGNYYDYRMARHINWLERKQHAMAITPFAQEMESARGVHPDTAAMLINERHRVWMLKSGQASEGIPPHSVLFDAPQVTDIFLMHFLRNSNKKTILPKRMLVDGRKNRFDPLGQVTEYEMYDRLVGVLERKGMIRKYNDFQIHEFIAPWEPQLVAEDYGLEWEQPAKAEQHINKKENQ